MTSSHRSPEIFSGQIRSRTSGAKISAPPPRQAPEPRVLETPDDLGEREPGDPGEVVDLHGGERLDVHLREPLPERAQHEEVKVEGKVRVEAADDVKLRRRLGARLFGPPQDLFHRHRVGEGLVLAPAERAELAPVDADVRRIDVPVHVEVDPVAVAPAVREVSHLAHRQDVPRPEEGKGVVLGETPAVLHLIAYRS